ncbi:hypothetical protein KY308_00025 [Candidatus Woesearchaeota archaeon]|nr:hypothetical protein [Candidatus Woesearchaeota archaeon]
MQTKKIIWMLVLLIVVAKASAIGIGAPNIDLTIRGEKRFDMYVINDEHKNITAKITVQGDINDNILLSTDTLTLSESEELKKFSVIIKSSENIEDGTKIVVSEIITDSGQILAVANAAYKLKVAEEVIEKEEKVEPTEKINKEEPEEKKSFEQKEPIFFEQAPEPSKKQIEKLSTENEATKLKEIVYKPLPLAVILIVIVALIASFDLLFLATSRKHKSHLESYVSSQRKIGKTDKEIKDALIGVGWDEGDADKALRKVK